MTDIMRRLGTFDVSLDLIASNYDGVLLVMEQCVVIGVEYIATSDVFRYTAVSRKWPVIEQGDKIPYYHAILKTENGKESFECWARQEVH